MSKVRPRLQSLKPRIATLDSRVAPLLTTRARRLRGSAGVKDRNRIRERDCGLCLTCMREGRTTPGTVVDHITPLWAGGSDQEENKQLLCDPCHEAKTAREAAQRASGG